jgi:O-antigen/teichoic acid export membrane protein
MSTAVLQLPEQRAAAGEGSRRDHRALVTAQASLASKAAGYGARLVSIPLALRLLGPAPYGLWLTAGSLIGWLNFADLGLGSGLVSAVAAAQGRSDSRVVQRLVSTAFAASLAVALLLAGAVLALARTDLAARLLGAGADPHLAAEARRLLILLGWLFAASFALSPVNHLCAALQEGYRAHLASIAATLTGLALLVPLWFSGASLMGFALAMGAPPLAATLALAAFLFGGAHRALRPRLAAIDLRSLATIFSQGGPLFLVTLSDVCVVYSINILVASRFGAAEVPRVAIPLSICLVFVNICGGITQPYWPACVEAAARRDWPWIRSASLRVLRMNALVIGAGALGTALLGRLFLSLWAGPAALPSQALLSALAVYALAQTFSYATGILLMGLGCLKTRAALHAGAAAAHWAGFALLASRFGLTALPLAGAAGYALESALAAGIAWHTLRKLARSR